MRILLSRFAGRNSATAIECHFKKRGSRSVHTEALTAAAAATNARHVRGGCHRNGRGRYPVRQADSLNSS